MLFQMAKIKTLISLFLDTGEKEEKRKLEEMGKIVRICQTSKEN